MSAGKNNNEEWKSKLRNYPAPWGELEIPNYLTITYPSSAMRKVDDMEALAAHYDKLAKAMVELSGTEIMIRHERIVYDVTIGGKCGVASGQVLRYEVLHIGTVLRYEVSYSGRKNCTEL
jgi:hypothetical protein